MTTIEINDTLWATITHQANIRQQSITDYITFLVNDHQSQIEAIQQSEAHYRHFIDNSLQGILMFQAGRIVFANKAALLIFGHTPAGLLAMSAQEVIHLVHPDDRELVATDIQKFWGGQQTESQYEFRIIRADKQTRIVEVFASLLTLHGKPAIQAAFVDRTEHRMAEEAYRSLVENSLQGLLIFQNNRIVFANSKASELLGYSIDNLMAITDPVQTLVHPHSQARAMAELRDLLDGQSVSNYELCIVTPQGEERWLHSMGTVITYQGQPAVQASIIDITKQRQAEKALFYAAAIIHSSDDAIIGKDLNGIIISWNPRAEHMYGYSPAEVIGKSISILVPPDHANDVPTILKHISQGESVDHYETIRVGKDGRLIDISLTVSPITNEAGQVEGASAIARDISDRKQAERALRLNEARLRLITDNMRDMVMHADEKGSILYVSPSALQVWGISPNEMVGSHLSQWLTFIHPEDREILSQTLAKRLKTGLGPSSSVYRFQHPSGELRWKEHTVNSFRSDDGSLAGFTYVIRDIDQRMQAVLALQKSEWRLRQAVNVAHLGVWDWDIATDRTVWAGEMFRMYGITTEEFTGKGEDYLNFTLPEDRQKQRDNIANSFGRGITEKNLIGNESNIPYQPNSFRILRRDGTICHVQGDAIAIVDEQGNPLRMIGILQDVTELQTTIEALHQSERRYRLVSELTSDFAYAMRVNPDRSLSVEWMTEAFGRMTGHLPQKMSLNHGADIIHPDDLLRYRQVMEGVFAGRPEQADLRIITAGGVVRWIRARYQPVWDEATNQITYLYGAAQDITERRGVEIAMQQAQKLESLGVLAGSVAHDFNNLLTAILAHASLIQLKLGNNNPVPKNLETIINTIERASEITRQLLAYTGKGRFEVVPINLNDLVTENTKLLQASLPKNIALVFMPLPDLLIIEGDRGQIQQVIMNLIINAADAYTGRAGIIEIRTTIQPILAEEVKEWENLGHNMIRPGPYASLTVKDEGQGMDNATLSRIFDPFFTTKETGRGLGLAAVQGIIRSHRGTLKVHSKPGHGTLFQVLFPISQNQSKAPEQSKTAPTTTTNKLILVVDDEKSIRNAISEVLKLGGYRLLTAENGEQALSICQEQAEEINLMLLDMTMPVLSGKETLHALGQRQLKLPIVLMSGYEEEPIDDYAQTANLVGFLKKPFKIETLLETIHKAFS